MQTGGAVQTINDEADLTALIVQCGLSTFNDDVQYSYCFDIDFPIQANSDGQVVTINSQVELNAYLNNLSNGSQADIIFPITVIDNNQTTVINNVYEFYDLVNSCNVNDCNCTLEYLPVCVQTPNGVIVYSNTCFAMCAGYTQNDFIVCNPTNACSITNLTTTVGTCNADESYALTIDFDYENTSATTFQVRNSSNLQVELGYQLQGNDISHSFSSKNQDLEIDLNQKQLFVISNVGFVNITYAFSSWKWIGGIRYNSYAKLNSTLIEPRILLQKKISNSLTGQISYEKKNQILSQFRESVSNDLSLENYIWIVSDSNQYPIQKAQQYTAGIIYKYQSWLFDVDAYYKTIDGITSLTFGFLNPTDAILHQGKGFTKGVDVLVQKSAPTWRTWVTYTYQDSQNKFETINENRYFPINANTRHAFNASFYKKWKNYSMALGWFWHSGKPYSILNESNQIDSFNTGQLPSYHRMDVSGMYHFHNQKSWSGKVGISIYNIYNQKTIISKEYERQYTSISDIVNTNYSVQNYVSLGIMPNVFLRIIF